MAEKNKENKKKRQHSITLAVGFQLIAFCTLVIIQSIFTLKIAEKPDLWWQVLNETNVSPFIILITLGIIILSSIFIAIGLYLVLKKDKTTIEYD